MFRMSSSDRSFYTITNKGAHKDNKTNASNVKCFMPIEIIAFGFKYVKTRCCSFSIGIKYLSFCLDPQWWTHSSFNRPTYTDLSTLCLHCVPNWSVQSLQQCEVPIVTNFQTTSWKLISLYFPLPLENVAIRWMKCYFSREMESSHQRCWV